MPKSATLIIVFHLINLKPKSGHWNTFTPQKSEDFKTIEEVRDWIADITILITGIESEEQSEIKFEKLFGKK